MTRQELAALLSASGFVENREHPGNYYHVDGRFVSVDYNRNAGERDASGFPRTEVKSVRVYPAEFGGYPTEYRQHFAPTLADLLRQGRI